MSAMAGEEESLESLLNKATNPLNRDEEWDQILAFCDQINKELEGPQIAVRLLAHKIQSPQEKEALLALSTLESCVKNCGKRFHQEIGKFRFLNEIIKVVSPKYLGSHTAEKVKKKCIELLYSWGQGLKTEGKVLEAYQMLKRQGIVTQDPVYVDQFAKTIEPPSPKKNVVFEDEDKSKLLSRLLKSKHPEDLQAANRLIKNMVKQDAERMEKVSRRVQQIETVNNNIKVLEEMLQHYRPGSASDAEKDLMKELYENLEKARPNLFRLASDTDEKDNEGINEILKSNDEVLAMMNKYREVVDGEGPSNSSSNQSRLGGGSGQGSLLLEDDVLGLIDMDSDRDKSKEPSVMSQLNKNDLDMLNDIFTSSASATEPTQPSMTADIGILNLGSVPTPCPAPPAVPTAVLPAPLAAPPSYQPQTNKVVWGPTSSPAGQTVTGPGLTSAVFAGTGHSSVLTSASPGKPAPTASDTTKTFDAFEDLGKSLMQQSLTTVTSASPIAVTTQNLTLNQMANRSIPSSLSTSLSGVSLSPAGVPVASGGISPVPTPPVSVTASPVKTASQVTTAKSTEIKPLTDISIPLESVQPSTHPPVTAYEKNNVKVVIHVGKDRPRPDVWVMVLSVMSTNSSPIRGLSFQAAVPKIMKIKLQPPSATELPAYNPILPPTAITQVMLVANPLNEKIRLKFKLTYSTDSSTVTDVGDVDTFEVQ